MLEKHPKSAEMQDVAIARSLIDDAYDIERTGRSRVIAMTFDALKRVERSLDAAVLRLRPRQWTERRVRAIVDREAQRIDHYEIEDLKKVRIEEARHELARSREREARLAALLANSDEDFHGPSIAAHEAMARGLVGPGTPVASMGTGDTGAATHPRGERRGGLAGSRDHATD